VWTVTGAPAPLHAEYDTAQAKVGTTSAWVQGPAAASTGGVQETQTAGMSADGNEVRFWLYFDTTNQQRAVTGTANSTTIGTFWLRFNVDGTLGAYTNRIGVAGYPTATYATVGTYTTGWTQYRIVYDFTDQGYTLSQRVSEGDAWTQLKSAGASDYTIPFRGTDTVTASDGTWFRAPSSANMWVDDIQYTNPDHTAPTITASVSEGSSYAAPVAVTFSADDAVEGPVPATATLNGNPFTSGSTISAAGNYTLVITASDSVPNTASSTIHFTVTGPPPVPLALVDDGFESGADGAALTSSIWTATGVPLHAEYDNGRAKVGTQSAWIQGPATGTGTSGVTETQSAGMTADGNEVRFWLYFDTTNEQRAVTGTSATTTDGTFWLRFYSDGTVGAYTNKAAVPGYPTGTYATVGTYTTGWTQYRIVYDFTNQGYTLSQRASEGDEWTQLKSAGASDYTIPFRGINTITASDGMWFRGYANANMWVDEVRHSDNQVPVITASVSEGSSYAAPVAVTFSADDAVEGPVPATATLNGSPFTAGSTISAAGNYTLAITASDSVPNTASSTIHFTVTAAPVVSTPASSGWSVLALIIGGLGAVLFVRRRAAIH
jgi:hypothetical protein